MWILYAAKLVLETPIECARQCVHVSRCPSTYSPAVQHMTVTHDLPSQSITVELKSVFVISSPEKKLLHKSLRLQEHF